MFFDNLAPITPNIRENEMINNVCVPMIDYIIFLYKNQ